ncbi:tumor necrosis factor receptor superfamily member 18 [Scomber scombrus]|uniref:tumor necrosis factor receptor superfamily member 18 n=1 Tax=Scomber scombrus TaxID=13677 RepID=UPI002DD7B1EA|nr:tumor necrosis factor receptor superfamily member 18 [Scomber scombrus]
MEDGRCCDQCPPDYAEKCTATTNANCSCRSGFLCSNNMCSKCEENKCVTGEKPLRTGLIEYSYQCKPACPEKEYYDAKMDICKPWSQCNVLGLGEKFPGNKTHNSICFRNDGGFLQVTLGIGFVLLSLTLLMLVSYTCMKVLRKHKAKDNPIDIVTVSTNTCDFHLSKEESGLQLFIQDESKDINSMAPLLLERVKTI